MKKIDVIRLSWKNILSNFSRSILALITLALLTSIIILMCNFCFYFKKTTDENILYNINQYGTFIKLSIKKDVNNSYLLKKIETKDVNAFISTAEELNLLQTYDLEYNEIDSTIPLVPFIGGFDNIEKVKGEATNYEDRGKNFIWINEEYSQTENVNLGDKITIILNDAKEDFIVKGITIGSNNFINYSYFDITSIAVTQSQNVYDDYSIIKAILKLKKSAPKDTVIVESSLNYTGFYYVFGLCIFLVLFCVLFSLGSILNVLKINIEDNNYSIGIMKSLGMKGSNIYLYIATQMFILVIVSTLISTLLSWIITKFTINLQIEMVGKMFYYEKSIIKSGFNFLFPLLNLIILGSVLCLGTLKLIKKHIAKNVVEIMQEVEY